MTAVIGAKDRDSNKVSARVITSTDANPSLTLRYVTD